MSVGNDGFTDCNYVCNPDNDMSWSCTNYCPEYKFTTLTTTKLTTAESVHANRSESEAVQISRIVYLCFGAFLFTIIAVTCFLNKKRICACMTALGDKRLQLPTQIQTSVTGKEADSGRHDADEDSTALLSIRSENGGNGDATEISSDSGVSMANIPVLFSDVTGVDGSAAECNEQRKAPELTYAGEHHSAWSQGDTEENDNPQDETAPKEVGEHACLAIARSSSFIKNVMATNLATGTTSTTVIENAENIHEGSDGHVINNDRSEDSVDDTDTSTPDNNGNNSDHGICSDENDDNE